MHYSVGISSQLSGKAAFLETAFRYDRHTAILVQKLDGNRDQRSARIHYTGWSAPLLLGARLHNSTSGKWELFLVSGGWLRKYFASSVTYSSWQGRRGTATQSAVTDQSRGIWPNYEVTTPELDTWHQEYGIESGFRIRINVKGVGRVEYGLTYEWALQSREGVAMDHTQLEQETQRLVPQVNAMRFNLIWMPLRWERSGQWQRIKLPKG